MQRLEIHTCYFTQSKAYSKPARQTPVGVQVHCTEALNPYLQRYVQPDDGLLGENKYNNSHNNPNARVCATAYIGKLKDGTPAVYLALPETYRCWLSGSGSSGNANRLGYIGYEVLRPKTEDSLYFEQVYRLAINLTAYWCLKHHIAVELVKSHKELAAMGLASNHADIDCWLAVYGKTMNEFRNEVSKTMAEGVEVIFVNTEHIPVKYQATVTCSGTYLNLRADKSTKSKSLKHIPKGTLVDVYDDSDETWWKIGYSSAVGYAMAVNDGTKWLTKEEDATDNSQERCTELLERLDEISEELGKLGEELDFLEKEIFVLQKHAL